MNLQNYINLFEKNKNLIINDWLKNNKLKEILDLKNINENLFTQNYANYIFNYFLIIITKKEESNNCPSIDNLIKYFNMCGFNSEELFYVCSAFKRAIIKFTYDSKINSFELTDELSNFFDLNFSIVLSKYTKKIKNVEYKLKKSLSIVNKYIILSKTDKYGVITEVSQAFCDISGYSQNELVGKKHNIVKHPDTNIFIFKELWQTILSGKVWKGELKNRKKDGTAYWVYATIEPIFDKLGKIQGFYAIRQDITSKKEFEEQQNILIQQSKSAAMGEMISMIAHQWRQPLQAISILIQKLPLMKMIEGDIPDEIINQVVTDAGIQLDYMSKTIDDFRDFFKPNRKKQEVKVSELINKTIDFLAYMLKIDTIKLTKVIEVDSTLIVHKNEVVQVLINIIKNARDVMVDNDIKNRTIDIRCFNQNNHVIIEIEDNAGGIPENIISKIFEPYFSTKENKNGTGLGLYMSKTIIEQHSLGRISAFNSDKGAVFKIELPLNTGE
ncbi:PAS domain-containing sensor histidine kinase [Arcobacter sp. CECT 8985]|uniref:sensor histidine kinase n=1 Tax=Arcobacter sp. CECT 8985 TaxID=1935424 RepID=UPI00100B0A43|nr:PAS domain-containing sensor histidine kinase [Arcobacter sp. CECT 8985]RXJ87542.1 hypothetical protein CRU93_03130 [Arcobacter sp. CECT 8985]